MENSGKSPLPAELRTAEGLRLHTRWWDAEGDPRAILVVIHGAAEHIGRYEALAEALNRRGFAVAGFDMRGHGRSDGTRLLVRSFDRLADDARQFLKRIRDGHPALPVFVFAHSMGGTVGTLLALGHPDEIDGLVLSGPLLKIGANFSPLLVRLAKMLGRVVPRLPLDRIDPSHLSRDEKVVRDYEADPLVHHGWVPAATGAAGIAAIQHIEREEHRLRVPTLILHGTDDQLADVDGSRRLYRNAASSDKTMKLYEGYFHEVLNERGGEHVRADLVEWLEARTPRS